MTKTLNDLSILNNHFLYIILFLSKNFKELKIWLRIKRGCCTLYSDSVYTTVADPDPEPDLDYLRHIAWSGSKTFSTDLDQNPYSEPSSFYVKR